MKALPGLLICLLLVSSCVAQEGPVADLQRRADQASGKDCVRLSIQAARGTLEAADRLFVAGDVKAAHKAVDAMVHFAGRSVDCSLQARKSEKEAEIDLRRLIRRTNDVQRTLDSEDRPHLAWSVTELEKQRDRLLHGIFGAAAGDTAEKKP
jgi:hypothetical protein